MIGDVRKWPVLIVRLCFGLLMKMDVNPNLAGKADLDKVKTSGASEQTAKQDGHKFWGKYLFIYLILFFGRGVLNTHNNMFNIMFQ